VFGYKFHIEFQHNGRLLREEGPVRFKFPWPPSKQPPELSVTFNATSNRQDNGAQFLQSFRILTVALSSLGNTHLPMRPTMPLSGSGIHHTALQNEVRISSGQTLQKMDSLTETVLACFQILASIPFDFSFRLELSGINDFRPYIQFLKDCAENIQRGGSMPSGWQRNQHIISMLALRDDTPGCESVRAHICRGTGGTIILEMFIFEGTPRRTEWQRFTYPIGSEGVQILTRSVNQ
jgi:hypothetical protein